MMKRFMFPRFALPVLAALGLLVVPALSASSASAAELKVLVVNQAMVFQNSLAGKDEAKKLQSIMAAITVDERAEMEPIVKAAQELQGQRALLGQEFSGKQMELQRKVEFIKYKFDQERKFTRESSQRLIIQKLYPIFNEIMQEKKGTLLLDQSQVIMTSPDYNITEDAVRKLDATMPTVDVKRVTFAAIQKAFEEQQARIKAAQAGKK